MTRPVLRRRAGLLAAATSLALGAALVPATASSAAPPATKPATAGKKPTYTIKDPDYVWSSNCTVQGAAFAPITGAGGTTRTFTGIHAGASYQMEVPADWNGSLVLWAHGYNGEGTDLCVAPPSLREYYVSKGYAWAASSYATNGYDVAQGVKDTHRLIGLFTGTVSRPSEVLLTGASMGGHITAVAIEQYPNAFDGALPICGVLGDVELFDYFLDANVTAAALAGAPKPAFPADPVQYAQYVNTEVAPELGAYSAPRLNPFTDADGVAWAAAVEQASGGDRPGFEASFAFWNAFGFGAVPTVPFLFGVYPGLTGGTIGIAAGNVASNVGTVYQLDGDPALSPAEQQLNAAVLRIDASPQGRHPNGLSGIPTISGDIRIPVVSLHNLGDLFVPFSMEQVYAERVAANGASDLLTQRVIRATRHCDFTPAELITAFEDLVTQVRTGVKPEGDVVLDAAVVAERYYGCAFTTRTRDFWEPCPTP